MANHPQFGRRPPAYAYGPPQYGEQPMLYYMYPNPQAPMGYMPGAAPPPAPPKHYSVDVECVAVGPGHNDREVAQVALVDELQRVLLNVYVRPTRPVVSYLTPLSGLQREQVDQGFTFDDAVRMLRSHLPRTAVLVGQNIAADIRWLGLREGVDFESLIDLSGAFRAFNPQFQRYSYFSLSHEARVLLGVNMEGPHNALNDAIVSIRLFNEFNQIRMIPEKMEAARRALLEAPIEPSFAKKNPDFEGVCMGNKKTCKCGQPFLY